MTKKIKVLVITFLVLITGTIFVFLNEKLAKAKELLIAEPSNFIGNWNAPEQALKRDLNDNSKFNEFNNNNSATPITWLETKNTAAQNIMSEDTTTTSSSNNTSTTKANNDSSSEKGNSDNRPSAASSTSGDTSDISTPLPNSQPEIKPESTPTKTVPTEPAPFSPPVEPAAESQAKESAFLWNIPKNIFNLFFTKAQAQDQNTATKEQEEQKVVEEKNNTTTEQNVSPTSSDNNTIPDNNSTNTTKSTEIIVESSTPANDATQIHTINQIENEKISLTISQFNFNKDTSYFGQNVQLNNTKLGLSLANQNLPGDSILVAYKKDDNWNKIATIDLGTERIDNNHTIYLPLTNVDNLTSFGNLAIKLTYQTNAINGQNNVFLDAVWLETEYKEEKPETALSDPDSPIKLISPKTSFAPDEHPHFDFSVTIPSSTDSIVDKIKNAIGRFLNLSPDSPESTNLIIKATVLSPSGEEINNFEPQISEVRDQKFSIDIPTDEYQFKPGTYKIKIDFYDNNDIFTYQQNFTLGVLTVNSNKSIYLPGDTAYLQMAALQPDGHTICNADLQLLIVDPNNQTSTAQIIKSGECGPDNVVNTPDYYSYYQTSAKGEYKMILTNLDNGNTITDHFEVSDSESLIVERIGPTRIFPVAPYKMIIKLKSTANLNGYIEERTPSNFNLISVAVKQTAPKNKTVSDVSIEKTGDIQKISWLANWKKDDEYVLEYTFKAPEISPFIYTLGKLNFDSRQRASSTSTESVADFADKNSFEESRRWQIASDAVDFIDPNIDGTTNCSVASPNSSHYQNVNDLLRQPDTSGATSSYIACIENQNDFFGFTTLTNINSISSIEAWVYHQDGNENMQWEIQLWNDAETTQYGSTQQLTNSTSSSWNNVTFSSLSLTQTDLNGLKIKYKNIKTGAGSSATSTIYSIYAGVTYNPANQAPSVSNVTLNSSNDITLTESTTTLITSHATVTDLDGYLDLQNVTGKIYRSGVTDTYNCTLNDNNCYQDTNCQLSNCSGNSCEATCSFSIQFHADPTDTSTPWSSEYWRAWIQVKDSINQTNNNLSASGGPDLLSLLSFSVTPSIGYNTLAPGAGETYLSHTTTVTSTGNCSLNITLYGTDMIKGSSYIPVDQQKFSIINSSSTLYASSTSLTASPGQTVSTSIAKVTASSTKTSANIWWGISLPTGLLPGNYAGTTTFIGVQNSLPWP